MYNYLMGGEQYRYATKPIIVTVPFGNPSYEEHCTDYHYVSRTKVDLSKKLHDLFGIHLDWHTFTQRVKGQVCWASSEVLFWMPGEDIDKIPATHTLCFNKPFREYLKKRPKLDLINAEENESGYGYWIYMDGKL